MTPRHTTVDVKCGCHPPIRRDIPADMTERQRITWTSALVADCRRARGCRCRSHELEAVR